MAGESSEREVAPGGFSENLDAGLRRRADELGLTREELLARLAGSGDEAETPGATS